MGDIVYLAQPNDFVNCTYFEAGNERIGLQTRDGEFSICRTSDNNHEIEILGKSKVFSREALAEFLHVASILLDDEGRWMPKDDLIAYDY